MKGAYFSSPVGLLEIIEADGAICRLTRADARGALEHSRLAELAAQQLAEYFCGTRQTFSLPLRPAGTAFARAVWQAMAEIPYGATLSYQQLAARIGRPTAARAVGQAVGRNPIWILLPCHRVVGASGSLTGYAGGLAMKRALLALEGVI